MMSIAQRQQATYADAAGMTLDLAPELLTRTVLFEAFESDLERLYRARADAQSAERPEPVSPVALIDQEIAVIRRELETASAERVGDLLAHIRRLDQAKERLATTRWTESQAIRQD